MSEEEDDAEDKCWSAHQKSTVIFAVVIVLVVAGVIAMVVALLATTRSRDSDNSLPTRGDGYLTCSDSERIPDLWYQCHRTYGEVVIIPPCREDMYAALKVTLASYFPGDLEINSCDPRNMALLSMADTTLSFNTSAETTPNLLERFALTTLYFSTNGNDWYYTSLWLSRTIHCAWHGINCDGVGRVIDIDLNVNNLFGSLPSELALLTDLKTLQMTNGALTGTIPSEVYRSLSNLEELSLVGHRLTELSPEVGQLRSLKSLRLDNNDFDGSTIPTEIGLLSDLEEFACSGCHLYGSLPGELGECTKLAYVYVSNNFLIGTIPELAPSILFLNVEHNDLDAGPFPTSLYSLTQLTSLHLSGNAFEGSAFPTEMLTSLTSLKYFEFTGMAWTGIIPTEISKLESLENLAVSGNSLIGTIPSEMGRLTRLQYLFLDSNDLTGSLPSELGRMTDLKVLNLDKNRDLDLSSLPPEMASLIGK